MVKGPDNCIWIRHGRVETAPGLGVPRAQQVDEVGDLGSSAGDPRLLTTVKGSANPRSDSGDKGSRVVVFKVERRAWVQTGPLPLACRVLSEKSTVKGGL